MTWKMHQREPIPQLLVWRGRAVACFKFIVQRESCVSAAPLFLLPVDVRRKLPRRSWDVETSSQSVVVASTRRAQHARGIRSEVQSMKRYWFSYTRVYDGSVQIEAKD